MIDPRTQARLRKLADTLNAVRDGMDEETLLSAATVGYLEASADLTVEQWNRPEFRHTGAALRRDIEPTKTDILPLLSLPATDLADALIALCDARAQGAIPARDLLITVIRDRYRDANASNAKAA
jgi:hypothetical protein